MCDQQLYPETWLLNIFLDSWFLSLLFLISHEGLKKKTASSYKFLLSPPSPSFRVFTYFQSQCVSFITFDQSDLFRQRSILLIKIFGLVNCHSISQYFAFNFLQKNEILLLNQISCSSTLARVIFTELEKNGKPVCLSCHSPALFFAYTNDNQRSPTRHFIRLSIRVGFRMYLLSQG